MRKMNLRAFWAWTSATFGMLGILVQFQNCAPSGQPSMTQASTDGEVRVVDDWSQKPLAFPDSLLQLHDETKEFVAQGLCPRKDEGQLQWALFDGSKSLLTGTTSCEMGGFQVELSSLDQFRCGESFLLQIFNESGDEAKTIVSRKCPPILAQQNFSNKASGESCFFELDRSPYSLDPVCYEACYVEERMAFREQTTRNKCGQQISGI